MADDIDAMLQSEDERSRSGSQTGNKSQGSQAGNPIEETANDEPGKVEWESLTGSAKDRFRETILEKRKLEQQLRERAEAPARPFSYQPENDNPEVKDAVTKLSRVGIATDEKVDSKITERIGQLQYQMYLDRLENTFTGDKGEPKFDRLEYEDFVSRHAELKGYLPEDVYKYKMYPEEYRDWEMRNSSNRGSGRSSKVLRPQKTAMTEDQLSPELIEQRLKEPDGPEWYAKNETKVNAALARMSSNEE